MRVFRLEILKASENLYVGLLKITVLLSKLHKWLAFLLSAPVLHWWSRPTAPAYIWVFEGSSWLSGLNWRMYRISAKSKVMKSQVHEKLFPLSLAFCLSYRKVIYASMVSIGLVLPVVEAFSASQNRFIVIICFILSFLSLFLFLFSHHPYLLDFLLFSLFFPHRWKSLSTQSCWLSSTLQETIRLWWTSLRSRQCTERTCCGLTLPWRRRCPFWVRSPPRPCPPCFQPREKVPGYKAASLTAGKV